MILSELENNEKFNDIYFFILIKYLRKINIKYDLFLIMRKKIFARINQINS